MKVVAFRCKCGKSTTDTMLTIACPDTPDYVHIACSQECVDKYGEDEEL